MTENDHEILIYTLNEMMEGHYRIMCALFDLKSHVENTSGSKKSA